MKTGKAVLVSVGIIAAVLAVAGGVGYFVYNKVESRSKQAAAQMKAEAERDDADRSAPQCGSHDDDERAKAVLAPIEPALQNTQRPVARIELEAMKADDVAVSKVGGRAYWAAGRDYPRDPQGQPLFLLAQIQLGELPKMPGYPERGMLQFFISGDDFYGAAIDAAHGPKRMDALAEPKGFRVVYWADASAPAIVPPAATAGLDALPFDPAKPRRIRFSADHETMGIHDVGLAKVLGTDIDALAERYISANVDDRVAAEDLSDEVSDYLDRSGHKLGGYPDFTQDDPRGADDKRVLLFQLDSDDGLMWGDSGIANFFIDPADLARADFSRVSYHWDCY